MENIDAIEILQEDSLSGTEVSENETSVQYPTQEDLTKFNNNFVAFSLGFFLVVGILCGLVLGGCFRGIFND